MQNDTLKKDMTCEGKCHGYSKHVHRYVKRIQQLHGRTDELRVINGDLTSAQCKLMVRDFLMFDYVER